MQAGEDIWYLLSGEWSFPLWMHVWCSGNDGSMARIGDGFPTFLFVVT